MNILKKYWPAIAHAAAVATVALLPSLKAYALSHPSAAALILIVEGWALHQAQSPSQS